MQDQPDLFPESVPPVEGGNATTDKKAKRTRSPMRSKAMPIIGTAPLPLSPKPFLGMGGTIWWFLLLGLLLIAALQLLDSLWHAEPILAVLMFALIGVSGALLIKGLGGEWRAVTALNDQLRRREVADQVLDGAELHDRYEFFAALMPISETDEQWRDQLALWLSSHSGHSSNEVLNAFIRVYIQPWREQYVVRLQSRLPQVAVASLNDPLSALIGLQRFLLVIDEVLAEFGIESGWLSRFRLLRAAVRHLAQTRSDKEGAGEGSVALAYTVLLLLLPHQPSAPL